MEWVVPFLSEVAPLGFPYEEAYPDFLLRTPDPNHPDLVDVLWVAVLWLLYLLEVVGEEAGLSIEFAAGVSLFEEEDVACLLLVC